MKKKKRTLVIICIGILITEGIFSFLWSTGKTVGEKTSAGILRTSALGHSILSDHITASGDGDMDGQVQKNSGQNNKQLQKIYRKNKNTLVLVNAENALDTSYDAKLIPICNGRLYASQRIYDALVQMLADAGNEGYQYWIASAWRSREKQQKLIDEDVRAGMQQGLSYEEALRQTYKETMPAGHSEHETGLALDILCSGNMNMDTSQADEPGNVWLRKNCWRYGFILRYPEDSEEITGVNYEPWHFRFVGKRAARYMEKQHITLEEFWDGLSLSN